MKRKLTEAELGQQLDFLKMELEELKPPKKKRKLDDFITAQPSMNKSKTSLNLSESNNRGGGMRAKSSNQPIIIQSKESSYEKGYVRKKGEKKKTYVRKMGGKSWEDKTLDDFPDNDFRIFVGNLGADATDKMLEDMFGVYESFAMARVVKDKRTRRERGYGFVSFMNADDFAKALMELDGEYIGTRPCALRKSNWRDRTQKIKKRRKKGSKKGGKRKKKKKV